MGGYLRNGKGFGILCRGFLSDMMFHEKLVYLSSSLGAVHQLRMCQMFAQVSREILVTTLLIDLLDNIALRAPPGYHKTSCRTSKNQAHCKTHKTKLE